MIFVFSSWLNIGNVFPSIKVVYISYHGSIIVKLLEDTNYVAYNIKLKYCPKIINWNYSQIAAPPSLFRQFENTFVFLF